jgi:hypothetical protein
MTACACGEHWRVEVCDLISGQVLRVVHPITMNWQSKRNDAGQGTLVLPIDTPLMDVWPQKRSVYISRVTGADASLYDPVCEFAGYIETIDFTNGTLQVGMQEVSAYLKKRIVDTDYVVAQRDQNEIAADLVNMAAADDGIPLTGTWIAGAQPRDRAYAAADHQTLFTLITELCGVENGPSWSMVHSRDPQTGDWSTAMQFTDWVGVERQPTLISDVQLFQPALQVTGVSQATHVVALGAQQQGGGVLTSIADSVTVHPRWDAVPSQSTVVEQATLDEAAAGYVTEWQDPVSSPGFTMIGLGVEPSESRIGDTLHVHLAFGPNVWAGKVQVESISWSLSNSIAEQRTFEVSALTDAADALVPNDRYCGACHAQS